MSIAMTGMMVPGSFVIVRCHPTGQCKRVSEGHKVPTRTWRARLGLPCRLTARGEKDSAAEEDAASQWAAADSDGGDLRRPRHLTLSGCPAQLGACFVEKAVAVQAAG